MMTPPDFSQAYFPAWILAQFTTDPWQYITMLSLSTCFFAGHFIVLYCKEIGLSPLAGLMIGRSSLATSPLFMYWTNFPIVSGSLVLVRR